MLTAKEKRNTRQFIQSTKSMEEVLLGSEFAEDDGDCLIGGATCEKLLVCAIVMLRDNGVRMILCRFTPIKSITTPRHE